MPENRNSFLVFHLFLVLQKKREALDLLRLQIQVQCNISYRERCRGKNQWEEISATYTCLLHVYRDSASHLTIYEINSYPTYVTKLFSQHLESATHLAVQNHCSWTNFPPSLWLFQQFLLSLSIPCLATALYTGYLHPEISRKPRSSGDTASASSRHICDFALAAGVTVHQVHRGGHILRSLHGLRGENITGTPEPEAPQTRSRLEILC